MGVGTKDVDCMMNDVECRRRMQDVESGKQQVELKMCRLQSTATVLIVAEHDVAVVPGLAVDGWPRVHTVLHVDVDGCAGGTRHVEHAEGGEQTPRWKQDV